MNPTQLYLDTARLGRMSSRAEQAQLDFTRMAGEQGASLFFERFLQDGSDSWPASVRSRFPGLTGWQGVTALKESLRTLAGSDPALPVLTANRSAQLMKFAARLLFRRCGNVLVTDLGWPPYHKVLGGEAARARSVVTTLPVRGLMSNGQATEDELVEAVRSRFLQAGCDGLFLTAVSNLGYRLPVERLVRALEAVRELRFVVIDGAQDFCHVSADLGNEYCDLYLASCHKWLQGFHPMGLGFYGRRRTRSLIETALCQLLSGGDLDDPLLRFTAQLERSALDGETETVNLIPLFTAQGAAADGLDAHFAPAHAPRRAAQEPRPGNGRGRIVRLALPAARGAVPHRHPAVAGRKGGDAKLASRGDPRGVRGAWDRAHRLRRRRHPALDARGGVAAGGNRPSGPGVAGGGVRRGRGPAGTQRRFPGATFLARVRLVSYQMGCRPVVYARRQASHVKLDAAILARREP